MPVEYRGGSNPHLAFEMCHVLVRKLRRQTTFGLNGWRLGRSSGGMLDVLRGKLLFQEECTAEVALGNYPLQRWEDWEEARLFPEELKDNIQSQYERLFIAQ